MLKGVSSVLGITFMLTDAAYGYDAKGPWTKVEMIYSKANEGMPYVYFNAEAMPGCHQDRSGYLSLSEKTSSSKTYATLLTALTADRDVRVFYNFNDVAEGFSGWGLCNIESIYIR